MALAGIICLVRHLGVRSGAYTQKSGATELKRVEWVGKCLHKTETLFTNIRVAWKKMLATNTPPYFDATSVTRKKFIESAPN
jgi:hypothetical protein